MFLSCSTSNNPSNKVSSENNPVSSLEEEKIKYISDNYQYLWSAKTVYSEPIVLYEHEEGGVPYGDLLFTPTNIISIKDQSLTNEYTSLDYYVEGNRVYRSQGSTTPYMSYDLVNAKNVPVGISTYPKKGGGNVIFTEGDFIVKKQIVVTYEHEDKWNYEIPKSYGDDLPILQDNLANKKSFKMVVNGDSIFVGCNSSQILNIPPYQESFVNAFKTEMENTYGCSIDLVNTSVGGKLSDWGLENIEANVNAYSPDLAIIGFGMNDGSSLVRVADYISNIKGMIDSLRTSKPECEIIVCGTIIPNIDSAAYGNQLAYLIELRKLVKQYDGVVLLDMTTFSTNLAKKKSSFELYANNINHPNDFLTRQYVANLMNLIQKKDN